MTSYYIYGYELRLTGDSKQSSLHYDCSSMSSNTVESCGIQRQLFKVMFDVGLLSALNAGDTKTSQVLQTPSTSLIVL